MDRKLVKILIACTVSLLLVTFISRNIFVSNTPTLNGSFIASLPQRTGSFFTSFFEVKATPSPIPEPTEPPLIQLRPTLVVSSNPLPTSSLKATSSPSYPTSIPTTIPPTTIPTKTPSPTKKPSPTISPPIQTGSCPTTSNNSYTTIRQNPNSRNRLKFNLATNAETNVALRGYFEVNESTSLISRNGNKDGLDPNMPPQISTLFQNHYPKIIKTYDINNWDYENNKPIPGQSATPAWKVHIIGLEATPGEALVGLKAGRTVDGSHVFLVMYAEKNFIMMVHSNEDTWDETGPSGYPFYFLEICVDPNLLALYEKNNAEGRNELPGVASGQVFGYAKTNEVKMTLRDTMSFMDPRYKEDWWEYNQ